MTIVERALQRMRKNVPATAAARSPDDLTVPEPVLVAPEEPGSSYTSVPQPAPAPAPLAVIAAASPRAVAAPVVSFPDAPAAQAAPHPGRSTVRLIESSAAGPGFDPKLSREGPMRSEVRSIKRQLLERIRERRERGDAPVVVVTSAIPGDGKSFTSFHLALSLSLERNLHVTLVDGDIAKQRIGQLFSGHTERTLTDCLRDNLSLDAAAATSDIDRLSIVLSGRNSIEASEYIASSRWDEAIASWRRKGPNELLLIDTAPVLATAEAQFVARAADLVIFVVRSEVTARDAVKEACERLGKLDNVEFVLNGSEMSQVQPYYGYSDYGYNNDRAGQQ